MAPRTHNFIDTVENIKVNYPIEMKTSEIPSDLPMFLRHTQERELFVTDDDKLLLQNGPLFTYITQEQAAALEFASAEEDGSNPFTTLHTMLLRPAPKSAKKVTITFA